MQTKPKQLQEYGVGLFGTIPTKSALKKALKKKLDLRLEVLFEDDYLTVIIEPAGISVSGNSFRTSTNALPQNLLKSDQEDTAQPQPVHRLDHAKRGVLSRISPPKQKKPIQTDKLLIGPFLSHI